MKGNKLELWIASLTKCNFITVRSNRWIFNNECMRLSILRRIMEIEEGVIRRGRRPRRITPFEISIILHMISGTGFQSLLVELGYWIPIVSGILDSFSCIPDSKAQDSGSTSKVFWKFHKQKFPGFRNPYSLTLDETAYALGPAQGPVILYLLPFFVTGANKSTQAVFGRRLRMKLNVSHKSRFFFSKRTKLDRAPWLTSSFVMETPGILHLL